MTLLATWNMASWTDEELVQVFKSVEPKLRKHHKAVINEHEVTKATVNVSAKLKSSFNEGDAMIAFLSRPHPLRNKRACPKDPTPATEIVSGEYL